MGNDESYHMQVNDRPYRYIKTFISRRRGYSQVHVVSNPVKHHKEVAIKEINLTSNDKSVIFSYLNEYYMMEKLRDFQFVVKLIDCELFLNPDKTIYEIKMVMEKGEPRLARFLGESEETTCLEDNEFEVIGFFKQMLEAIDELHKNDIIHGNLTVKSFLTVKEKLRLIGFSFANSLGSEWAMNSKVLSLTTHDYIAPELLEAREANDFCYVTSKVDIYAIGCILYQMIYGKDFLPNEILFDPISNNNLLDCVKACLDSDPRFRPTARELLGNIVFADWSSNEELDGFYVVSKKSSLSFDDSN